MAMSGVFGTLRRRWYLVLAGLLLTAGLTAGAAVLFQPSYTARGLVLLIPPVDAETATGSNPFLGLGGLDLPARVLVASYSSNAAQQDIAKRAPDAEVTVSMEESTRGPVIAVDVKDSSAKGALGLLDYVSSSIPETLQRLQSEVGTPPSTTVTSIPLTMDTEAEVDRSDSMRMIILAAGAGVGLTVLMIFVVESLGTRPALRRRGAPTEPLMPAAGSGPELEVLPLLRAAPADPRPAARTTTPGAAGGAFDD